VLRHADLERFDVVRLLRGRNRTKADVRVHRTPWGDIAIKDYGARPWVVRHTLGRFLIRREAAAYRAAGELHGLVRCFGRVGPFALATAWIEARTLAGCADGSVEVDRFDRLLGIVRGLHRRGIAVADLHYRDVLLVPDGTVRLIDLAMAFTLGGHPGRLRRAIFERLVEADLWAVARLRRRFGIGHPPGAASDHARRAVVWHRRARRVKWYWDKLRGAPRLPPTEF
jgi:hypothetical protein